MTSNGKDRSGPPDRLEALRLLAYGAPGLPLAGLLLPLYVLIPAHYADTLGLGFATVGIILLMARLWDVVTDPLIGVISDRLRSRFGRRRPVMVAGVPITVAATWALFVPPENAGAPWLFGASLTLYLGATMILLPYYAWGAELSGNYQERSRIAGARETFVVIGTVVAAGLPSLFGDAHALTALAAVLGILLPVTVVLACRFVPEPKVGPSFLPGRQEAWRTIRRNGPFRRLLAAYLLNGIANGLPATLFLLYTSRVLQTESWPPLLLVYFLCGIGAVPIWIRLAGRFGKHRVWNWAMLWACAAFVWVPLLGPGDVAWFVLVCVLTGASLGADLVLPPAMQADVVDIDIARTGQIRTGLYFALWGIATKLALALAVGIAFPLLELAGLDPSAGELDEDRGLLTLAALYSLAPIVFKLSAIALMHGFPLTRARQEKLRQVIESRQSRVQKGK